MNLMLLQMSPAEVPLPAFQISSQSIFKSRGGAVLEAFWSPYLHVRALISFMALYIYDLITP